MRKNRSNNGYIGANRNTPYEGSMAPSNVNRELSLQDDRQLLNNLNAPTSGNGYGATASVALTTGKLMAVYPSKYDTVGTAYSTNNRFRVSGGGGITAFGSVVTVDNGGIHNLGLHFPVSQVDIVEPGVGYSSAPALTFSSSDVGGTSITASIAGNVLTVTSSGSQTGIVPGALVSGTGVATSTIIVDYDTGRGGTGTYLLNNSQTVTSRSMTISATATGVATVSDGRLTGISMTYFGVYKTQPTISLGGTPLVAAKAVVRLGEFTGYTGSPTITFLNPFVVSGATAAGATASALILYDIQSIGVSSGGQGYASPPSVVVGGRGAERSTITATASVDGGTVSQITAITGDVLFSSVPSVTVGGWIDLPTVSEGEQKFVGTYAIFDDDNYVAFTAGETYNVDWGDGTTGTFNNGATATKIYSPLVFAGITQNPIDGHKTVTITITPVSGSKFTSLNLNVRHPSLYPGAFNFPELTSHWLSIRMASNQLRTLTISSISKNITHRMLERFEFIGPPLLGGPFTSAQYMFYQCVSLVECIAPRLTEQCTDLSYMFSNCNSLKTVVISANAATNMNNMFSGCNILINGPIMDTRNVTDMAFMFSNCRSLREVPLYNTSKVTTMASMFAGCYGLKTIPQFDTGKVTNFTNTFNACRVFETIPHLDTSSATNMDNTFTSCPALRRVPWFNTSKVTSMNSMFSGCNSLEEVPLFDMSSVTVASNMFSNCYLLKRVPKFDTRSLTNSTSMFAGSGIQELPEMNFLQVNTATSMFNSSNLVKCPSLYMPLVLSTSSMFSQCSRLKEVGNLYMPRCTNLDSMFSSCQVLQYPPEIVKSPYQNTSFASTISCANMFSSCARLKRVPLFETTIKPISSNSSSSYSSMFNSCVSLSEIPEYDFMGASGSSNTGALSLVFSTCHNIRRIKAKNFCQSFALPNPNMMGATALNELYTNLAVVGASGAGAKTLTVSGSLGTAGDNPGIATAKGWTITG